MARLAGFAATVVWQGVLVTTLTRGEGQPSKLYRCSLGALATARRGRMTLSALHFAVLTPQPKACAIM